MNGVLYEVVVKLKNGDTFTMSGYQLETLIRSAESMAGINLVSLVTREVIRYEQTPQVPSKA